MVSSQRGCSHQRGGKTQILDKPVPLGVLTSRDHIMVFFDFSCKDRFTSLSCLVKKDQRKCKVGKSFCTEVLLTKVQLAAISDLTLSFWTEGHNSVTFLITA